MSTRCYPYRCHDCGFDFDVFKSIEDIDNEETCQQCHAILTSGNRYIGKTHFFGEKVEEAEFCPALGTVVKNSNHRAKIAKERGLIEIGNEDPEKMQNIAEKDRQTKNDKVYDDYFDNRITVSGK